MRIGGWQWLAVGLGVCVLAGGAPPTAGKSEPAAAENKVLDQHMADVLKEIHNRGADLYNNGDVAGCYRLFQGALMTVRPLLDHHAQMQKSIETGLTDAENNPDIRKRAFTLHRLIEDIRAEVKAAAKDK